MSDTDPSSPYGYVPTLYVCAIYVGLFSVSAVLHLCQACYFRIWWLVPTVVTCGLAETLGWTARLWSSENPDDMDPFLIQITTTIIAPSFLTAANFIILGKLIASLGPQYSRLSPRLYGILFGVADLIALIVQAVGGAMAADAAQTGNGDPNDGGHVMLGGIFWQIAAITVYVFLAVEFFLRVWYDRPLRRPFDRSDSYDEVVPAPPSKLSRGFDFGWGSKLSLMVVALVISTSLIYIRSVYRTIELLNGWTGTIITTEIYFNVFDGMPITVALYTMNVLHPGWIIFGPSQPNIPSGALMELDTPSEGTLLRTQSTGMRA